MSDEFIPLNQSTPVRNTWQGQNRSFKGAQRYHKLSNSRDYHNRQRNPSQKNSSYGSDSTNSSYGYDKNNIDAYLHPSMLQDPWAELKAEVNNTSKSK